MSPIQVLLALHILSLSICILTCLPITSKPIENTPENLAWEAWIMVPPTQDKTRKITPKSIFILPNKTNGGSNGGTNTKQIQCPPGHRIDNYRCIPTVSIDRDQILIAQLTNLLHSTDKQNSQDGHTNESTYSYEYDYDYGDGYDPETAESLYQAGNVPPDYNGEPLKINLSLGKFPTTRDESKDITNFGVVEDVDDIYDDLKVQPFRAQETSSTTTNTATSSKISSTTPVSTTTASSTSSTTQSSEDRSETIVSELDISTSSHSSSKPYSTTPGHSTTSSVLILSPAETEIDSMKSTSKSDRDADFDYSFYDSTTSKTTGSDDSEIDIVTEAEETKADLKEDLVEELLVFDKIGIENSTEPEQSTDIDFTTTTILNQDDITSQTDFINHELRSSTKKLEEHTLPPMQNETVDKSDNNTRQEQKISDRKAENVPIQTDHDRKNQEPIRVQNEQEPIHGSRNQEPVPVHKEQENLHDWRNEEPIRVQNEQEPTHDDRNQEPVRMQEEQETLHDWRNEEPIRVQKEPEPIHGSRNQEPIRVKNKQEPMHSSRNQEPFHVQDDPIHGRRNQESMRIQDEQDSMHGRRNQEPSRVQNQQESIHGNRKHEPLRVKTEQEPMHGKKNQERVHVQDDPIHGRRTKEPIRVQNEQEPLLESIESNNRFVYHHLGSNLRQHPDKVQTTTPDIQEQLRIINRIVEENKRRAQQQHARIRFPTEPEEPVRRENYKDYIRFPDSVSSHVPSSSSYTPSQEYRSQQFPIHKKFPEWLQQPTIITPASPPNNQQTQKPFWWLPNGFEVDRNGDKPLLLRFWSRTPIEQDPNIRPRTSSSSSTSGYRENSRSPTENLYKEISAQEVYKVLGAKQWKHNR